MGIAASEPFSVLMCLRVYETRGENVDGIKVDGPVQARGTRLEVGI